MNQEKQYEIVKSKMYPENPQIQNHRLNISIRKKLQNRHSLELQRSSQKFHLLGDNVTKNSQIISTYKFCNHENKEPHLNHEDFMITQYEPFETSCSKDVDINDQSQSDQQHKQRCSKCEMSRCKSRLCQAYRTRNMKKHLKNHDAKNNTPLNLKKTTKTKSTECEPFCKAPARCYLLLNENDRTTKNSLKPELDTILYNALCKTQSKSQPKTSLPSETTNVLPHLKNYRMKDSKRYASWKSGAIQKQKNSAANDIQNQTESSLNVTLETQDNSSCKLPSSCPMTYDKLTKTLNNTALPESQKLKTALQITKVKIGLDTSTGCPT